MRNNNTICCRCLWMVMVSVMVLVFTSLNLGAELGKIPACLLNYQFGPERHAVVVEKSSQRLLIYSNYKAEPVATFDITTGKKNGQKLSEGDMKTPEGIYFFGRVLSGDQLPKIDDYGDKAFTLNYPNAIDRQEDRKGSGIWLHGAFDAAKIDRPNNSRGCVVMRNDDLIKASKYIFLNRTPICIYETIKYDTPENIRARRERLIGYLKDWKMNWENKDINGYIKHYHRDFHYDGMDLPRFKAFKNRLNSTYKFIRVMLSEIDIYGYDDYYVVMFNQLYVSDRNHFYSKKLHYWWDYGNNGKIARERTYRLPPLKKFEVSTGNYITVEQFRRDYLAQLKKGTFSVSPPGIVLKNISILGETVKIALNRSGNVSDGGHFRVIPVLRLQNHTDMRYRSLAGIELKEGIPQDYSKGVPLARRDTLVMLDKEEDYKIKSLTLFLVNSGNTFEQIITYFVNQ